MSGLTQEFAIALPVLSKLLLGAVLGALIGIEREAAGRPAGIRTHMLIVIGCVLISEVSKAFPGYDGSRIAAQIVTGIGFIGAGTILRMGAEIKGLTSAASVWAASGVGMAISVGGPFIMVSILATVLIVVTLAFVSQVERRFYPRPHRQELVARLTERGHIFTLLDELREARIAVESIRVLDEELLDVALSVVGPHEKALSAAIAAEGVLEAKWL